MSNLTGRDQDRTKALITIARAGTPVRLIDLSRGEPVHYDGVIKYSDRAGERGYHLVTHDGKTRRPVFRADIQHVFTPQQGPAIIGYNSSKRRERKA